VIDCIQTTDADLREKLRLEHELSSQQKTVQRKLECVRFLLPLIQSESAECASLIRTPMSESVELPIIDSSLIQNVTG
jgi:hypothetical protein